MNFLKGKKTLGLIILLIIYAISFLIGAISYILLEDYLPVIYNLLVADVIATIVVWIFGIIFNTASIYDPYWSVQTVVIYVALQIEYNNFNLGNCLFLVCLSIWAIRLTVNFAYGFNDITYIDWRYAQIREKTKGLYQIVNLLGIHLVPTFIVFAASVPAFLYVINGDDFNALSIIGMVIMLCGVLLEVLADLDMIKFKKTRIDRSQIINVGLWKYSRHPNYLGEISFWYGVALVFVLPNLNMWYVVIGAILNTLLFLFISIPFAENHMKEYKAGFEEYKKRTRMLLPIKK